MPKAKGEENQPKTPRKLVSRAPSKYSTAQIAKKLFPQVKPTYAALAEEERIRIEKEHAKQRYIARLNREFRWKLRNLVKEQASKPTCAFKEYPKPTA